jgi:hypothetical protein
VFNLPREETKKLHLYEILRRIAGACDGDKIDTKQLQNILKQYKILENIELLQKLSYDETKKQFPSPESRKKFKSHMIATLLYDFYNKCLNDKNELIFFAAATFNLGKLNEIIKECDYEDMNQTRFSESVIIFTLKYGMKYNENFFECMKMLIDAAVDVNKFDFSGKFAIDYIAMYYRENKNDGRVTDDLKRVGRLLLDKGVCQIDNTKTREFVQNELDIDLSTYTYVIMDDLTKLFYWIVNYSIIEFLSFDKIRKFVDCDNGENTILQFASKKSERLLPVVKFLLNNGADPNKTTKRNELTPLELAAYKNHQAIFEEILKNKRTKITQDHLTNFVKGRSHPIKPKLFEIFLESDKLNPNLTYKKTGNTPLHYAIYFSHKNAIQKLLKRSKISLTIKNNAGKCAFDMIDVSDLKNYFDSCVILDNSTPNPTFVDYKTKFNFKFLVAGSAEKSNEIEVISAIGKYKHLENLLTHPLINVFLSLKWFKAKFYFWTILLIQTCVFLTLTVFFYHFTRLSTSQYVFCILTSFLNVVIKCFIFRFIIKDMLSFSVGPTTLHELGEILLMITIPLSFFLTEFRAFIFIEMAILLLLTAGYHPKLSKWSIMLQVVFKNFTFLLIFFSVIMIAFAVGFHILFFQDHDVFKTFYRSLFTTYLMTLGEINLAELNFETTAFEGYLIFLLCTICMSLVILNFWTGAAITNIEQIEKNSKKNAAKNVIAFLSFVETNVYSIDYIKKCLPNPLLFLNNENEKYEVDFYMNDDQHQFRGRNNFPHKVDQVIFDKIKCHHYMMQNKTTEKQILLKFDKIVNILNKLNFNAVESKKVRAGKLIRFNRSLTNM